MAEAHPFRRTGGRDLDGTAEARSDVSSHVFLSPLWRKNELGR
jgi:hypothetical protein